MNKKCKKALLYLLYLLNGIKLEIRRSYWNNKIPVVKMSHLWYIMKVFSWLLTDSRMMKAGKS